MSNLLEISALPTFIWGFQQIREKIDETWPICCDISISAILLKFPKTHRTFDKYETLPKITDVDGAVQKHVKPEDIEQRNKIRLTIRSRWGLERIFRGLESLHISPTLASDEQLCQLDWASGRSKHWKWMEENRNIDASSPSELWLLQLLRGLWKSQILKGSIKGDRAASPRFRLAVETVGRSSLAPLAADYPRACT